MRLLAAIAGLLLNGTGFALTGKMTGVMSAVAFPASMVAGWLPEEVSLANPAAEEHQVIIFAGGQRSVAHLPAYNEVIVIVPDVVYRGKAYMYFPKLYLDNWRAVFWGKSIWGFPKVMGNMSNASDHFRLDHPKTGAMAFDLNIVGLGETVDKTSENYAEMKASLSLPMLLSRGKRVLCSRFMVNLDQVELTAVEVSGSVQPNFMPGANALEFSSGSLNNQAFGSFHLKDAFWRVPDTGKSCSDFE